MFVGRKLASFRRPASAGFTWLEVAVVVSIVGVLAAVAVPVLLRHERQTRTTEIPEKLALIYRGSVAYYVQTSRATTLREDGTPTPAVFPAGDGPTPAKRCCEEEDNLCTSDAKVWTSPTWEALRFSIRGQHQYQYTYESAGEGPLAEQS